MVWVLGRADMGLSPSAPPPPPLPPSVPAKDFGGAAWEGAVVGGAVGRGRGSSCRNCRVACTSARAGQLVQFLGLPHVAAQTSRPRHGAAPAGGGARGGGALHARPPVRAPAGAGRRLRAAAQRRGAGAEARPAAAARNPGAPGPALPNARDLCFDLLGRVPSRHCCRRCQGGASPYWPTVAELSARLSSELGEAGAQLAQHMEATLQVGGTAPCARASAPRPPRALPMPAPSGCHANVTTQRQAHAARPSSSVTHPQHVHSAALHHSCAQPLHPAAQRCKRRMPAVAAVARGRRAALPAL
jgi:hypothetical protein